MNLPISCDTRHRPGHSELARFGARRGGYYNYWETGSHATFRELLVNEGLAVAAARLVAPGFDVKDYLGYGSRQYKRLRELDAFLYQAIAPKLDQAGLGIPLEISHRRHEPHRAAGGR